MTAENKQENAEVAEQKAKKLGIKLLKIYGAVYLVVIVLYAIHLFSGSEALTVSEIEPGRRVWNELSFEYDNVQIEVAAGSGIRAPVLERFKESRRAEEIGDGTLDFYRKGFFYNLPWTKILGILNFTGLALLLYTALGDMIPKVLEDYSKKLDANLSESRKAKQEAEDLKQKYRDMEREVEEEKARLMELAKKEAKHEYDRIIEKTKDDIERMKEGLERHIDAELRESIQRLRADIGREALELAKGNLKEESSSDKHHALISDLLFELKGTEIK